MFKNQHTSAAKYGKGGQIPGASNTQTSPAKLKAKGKARTARPSAGLASLKLYGGGGPPQQQMPC